MEEERGQEEKQKKKKRGRETLVRESGGVVPLSATGCQCVHTVNAEPQFTGQSLRRRSVSLGVRMGWDGGGGEGGGSSARPGPLDRVQAAVQSSQNSNASDPRSGSHEIRIPRVRFLLTEGLDHNGS